MVSLYRKLLGHPFVYDQIRPRVVGGIDMKPLYELLQSEGAGGAGRVVLDVGCGTGDALRHLSGFERYVGFDTDEVAIAAARARHAGRENVRFEARELTAADVREIAPTGVVLAGVLHHLPNSQAEDVLRLVLDSKNLVRVVTSDIVFIPGKDFNNVLAMLDRGRHCRAPDAYAQLARSADFDVVSGELIGSTPGSDRVQYFIMALSPRKNAA